MLAVVSVRGAEQTLINDDRRIQLVSMNPKKPDGRCQIGVCQWLKVILSLLYYHLQY